MKITAVTSGLFSTNSYLIENGDSLWVIDAPDGNGEMMELIRKKGHLDAVLLTHAHFDHIMGLEDILSLFPSVPVYLDFHDLQLLYDNRKFLSLFGIPLSLYSVPGESAFTPYPGSVGPFKVLKTPGHTPGSVALYQEEEGILFSGDTLFSGGEGRTDLGGSYPLLKKSLEKLKSLPPETSLFPGHGESTSVRKEKNFTYRF